MLFVCAESKPVHAADAVQDLRLLFRVRKQDFVEKLRSNSEEGRKLALGACMSFD
jgi:hypothetical protein